MAQLVTDEDAFKDAFAESTSIDITTKKKNGHQSARSVIGGGGFRSHGFMDLMPPTQSNSIDVLLEASKTFIIGDRNYIFSEDDRIFFMTNPLPKEFNESTKNCNTCGYVWKK